jgi:cysteine-S-conjugate beta-lyase
MSTNHGLDRRSFLRNAQMTAFLGAVGAGSPLAADAPAETSGGKFDFDTPYSRIGTDCIKWDRQIQIYGKENIVAGMGIADMDFRCAPAISKALADRVKHENWGYLELPKSYAEGIIKWNKRRYGIDINPDLMLPTDGVHPAIITVLKTFSPPGTKVLLLTPTYDGFYGDVSYVQCKPEECLMRMNNGRYSIDFDEFKRHIGYDTHTLILCNPQNPTGNMWSPEDLTKIGEICAEHRVLVLADEIHCDFVTKGNKYTPFSTLPNKDIVKNSITFKAASKSFGLSAMKCGWMFSTNPDLINRVKVNHHPDLNTLGIVANQAAYAGGEEWLNQLVDYIDANHQFVTDYIAANIPLIKHVKPQGTYLTWPDVSGVVEKIGAKEKAAEMNKNRPAHSKPITPENIVERWLVDHAKVQINAGTNYGLGGAGRMRMNIATSRKTLELALGNIAEALKKA